MRCLRVMAGVPRRRGRRVVHPDARGSNATALKLQGFAIAVLCAVAASAVAATASAACQEVAGTGVSGSTSSSRVPAGPFS